MAHYTQDQVQRGELPPSLKAFLDTIQCRDCGTTCGGPAPVSRCTNLRCSRCCASKCRHPKE